ncbi:hypothetical protein QBA36_38690 [Streptomyces stelliscabiei]
MTDTTSDVFTAAVTLTPAEAERFDLAFTAVTQPCPCPRRTGVTSSPQPPRRR